jgi:hypothetical protein
VNLWTEELPILENGAFLGMKARGRSMSTPTGTQWGIGSFSICFFSGAELFSDLRKSGLHPHEKKNY